MTTEAKVKKENSKVEKPVPVPCEPTSASDCYARSRTPMEPDRGLPLYHNYTGTVDALFEVHGYGFIREEKTNESHYFRFVAGEKYRLRERISYILVPGVKGKRCQADELKKVSFEYPSKSYQSDTTHDRERSKTSMRRRSRSRSRSRSPSPVRKRRSESSNHAPHPHIEQGQAPSYAPPTRSHDNTASTAPNGITQVFALSVRMDAFESSQMYFRQQIQMMQRELDQSRDNLRKVEGENEQMQARVRTLESQMYQMQSRFQ